jgi:uncharacterized protein (TIGR02266 family)
MEGSEKRKFKRLDAQWVTKIRKVTLTDSIRERLERIRNVSLGGVFVDTPMPFEVGAIVALEFGIPGVAERVQSRGIVRWSNDGRAKGQPIGMGVEFLEVTARAKDALDEFFRFESCKECTRILTKTPLHQSLLRFYCRKLGGTFSLADLAEYMGCDRAELLASLKDFAGFGLVRTSGENVQFAQAKNPDVTRAVQGWYEGLEHGRTPLGGIPIVPPS